MKTTLSTQTLIVSDTCAFPQMILKLHSGFSGIQTHDLCLITGYRSLQKSAMFKMQDPERCTESVL